MSGGGCSGPNPSPINLSQSFAKPCNNLCDLVMDDGYATKGTVISFREGLVLMSDTNLGTCKFNGDGYSCYALLVSHPSHHTIENIQADAEAIALFRNPTGKNLVVSSLVRVNPAQTQASHFFNKFIPYVVADNRTQVTLNNWSLSMMVPPNASFYSYKGSSVDNCLPAQFVVFNSMINIDSNDFALLVKKVPASSRGIQPLGNREVYFNNGQQLPGPNMPKDGKIYMRLHSAGAAGIKYPTRAVKQVDVTSVQDANQQKAGAVGNITKWAQDQVTVNGYFSIINTVLLLIALGGALYCAYSYNNQFSALLTLNIKAQEFARWIRSFIFNRYSKPSASSSYPVASAPTLESIKGKSV